MRFGSFFSFSEIAGLLFSAAAVRLKFGLSFRRNSRLKSGWSGRFSD
jgi:hypothetical protein